MKNQTHRFVEDAALTGVRLTNDGYLAGVVRCARTGIQDYLGSELGRPDLQRVRVHRPESAVFDRESMNTYAGKPLTIDHPSTLVTADNWKELAVGQIGSDVIRDGEHVNVSFALMDSTAIKQVQDGKREVSMGYLMDLDFTAGETETGEAYDAVMTNLRMNHLAIVDKGRAGSSVRIGDSWQSITDNKQPSIKPMKMQTIVSDGISVEINDAAAEVIAKLQGQNTVLVADAKNLVTKHEQELAAKDTAIAAKDTEIKDLKGKVLDGAALDAAVVARSELVAKAKTIATDADFTGKSDLEIKTMAVTAALGADAVANKSEAYIDAAFDMAQPVTDSFVEHVKTNRVTPTVATDNGQEEYEWNLKHAYLGDAAPKFPGATK